MYSSRGRRRSVLRGGHGLERHCHSLAAPGPLPLHIDRGSDQTVKYTKSRRSEQRVTGYILDRKTGTHEPCVRLYYLLVPFT